MASKAHPDARYRGIGFKIGDAFPAGDLDSRCATVLGMAANNTVYLNVRIIEGELPPELNIYYFRLVAAHFFEAVLWLRKTRSLGPVQELIRALPDEAQMRLERLVRFSSQRHPLYVRLRRSRITLFHLPTLRPDKARNGAEELAKALVDAKDLDGWIEGGDTYATFRATFADEVAL